MVDLYRYGVYGLDSSCEQCAPSIDRYENYPHLSQICKGNSVILSPYAKSVPMLPIEVWSLLVEYIKKRRYQVFTNIVGREIALPGTIGISPSLSEIKSVVERGGVFISIRSGLCDILLDAKCKKIALYPHYYYMDTAWNAYEMYELPGWTNIVVRDNKEDICNSVLHAVREFL